MTETTEDQKLIAAIRGTEPEGQAERAGHFRTLALLAADRLAALTTPQEGDARETIEAEMGGVIFRAIAKFAVEGSDRPCDSRPEFIARAILAAFPVLARAAAPEPAAVAVLAPVRRYLERFNPGGTHSQNAMAQALENILEGAQVAWAPSDDDRGGANDAAG